MTAVSDYFFNEASWQKHDEGYERGYPSRRICDRKFLEAMLRDAKAHPFPKKAVAYVLAWASWAAVRTFGSSQYNYAPKGQVP
jgi:hypothetical protein